MISIPAALKGSTVGIAGKLGIISQVMVSARAIRTLRVIDGAPKIGDTKKKLPMRINGHSKLLTHRVMSAPVNSKAESPLTYQRRDIGV